jgi:hypothetical protein
MITQISQGSGGGSSADEKAKVSSNDTTAGYLNGKLVAGTNVTLTENNNGGDETLTISAAGGVTGFTSSQNTASPNNTVNASRLLVDATSTNADIVLQPKGSGAILAQLPDGTNTGGNKRGASAVDFQRSRSDNFNVASGSGSCIITGNSNTNSSTYAGIVGGEFNTITSSAPQSFIGAGYLNTINNSCDQSFIGSGQSNQLTTNSGYGVICGGMSNTITNSAYSAVLSGRSNNAGRANSVISGGQTNTMSTAGTHHTIVGGQGNTTTATHCAILGGQNNAASAQHAVISGGRDQIASGTYSTVSGGYANTASGTYSASVGYGNTSSGESSNTSGNGNTASSAISNAHGFQSVANNYGMYSYASGRFTANGDAQLQEQLLRCITTNNTATLLVSDGLTAGTSIAVANDTTIGFDILVVARRTDADNESSSWRITGCIDNNAGNTAFVGTPTVTAQGDDSAGAWTIAVQANNTDDRLEIVGTGENSKTIRWLAHARCVKITG